MPCAFTVARLPCQQGDGCGFCHLCYERQIKPRPRKAKRDRCKRAADKIDDLRRSDAEAFRERILALNKKGAYMNKVFGSKLKLVERDESFSAQIRQVAREVQLDIVDATEVNDGDATRESRHARKLEAGIFSLRFFLAIATKRLERAL
mmetsp:Transcript_91112/g.257398  ORF Transcript_91112/g.257398 Transcript_91112/m.257398 type:complete len:149 (+) Transcript_91112:1-447(+)